MKEKNNRRKHSGKKLKNEKKIMVYLKVILLLVLAIILSIYVYINNVNYKYMEVNESSEVDYKVYLNNNEFYENEYRESDKQYVSSLISKIVADFNYNLDLSEDSNFNYTYRIDATLNITDSKNNNSLYENTKSLVEETSLKNNENGTISINEEIDIDYSEYNNIAKGFLNTYGLSSSCESILDVTLYVKSDNTEESTVTLSIPLAQTTISIESSENLVNESNPIIIHEPNNILRYGSIVLILGCIIGIIIIVRILLKEIYNSLDDDKKYKIMKRRILMTYGEAIDKVILDYEPNFSDYWIIKFSKFVDLLKVKEDLSQPILMFENEEDANTIFFIPNNTKFMYIYVLGKEREMLAEKNETNTQELSEIGSN